MSWQRKDHPRREAGICEIQLIGHKAVRITFGYTTKSKDNTTYHNQEIELSLCDAQFLGWHLHNTVAKGLQEKLDDFKRGISGG